MLKSKSHSEKERSKVNVKEKPTNWKGVCI